MRRVIRIRGGGKIELEYTFNNPRSTNRIGDDRKFDLGEKFGGGESFVCRIVWDKLTF
jgi:hypothetical protein